jgi:hypothetical protein
MAHPPLTFADISHIVVQHLDADVLLQVRHVDRRSHRVANDELASMFQHYIDANRATTLGFPANPFAVYNGILYRGDTRPPGQLFGLGFTKPSLARPHISGEKVKNIISTSKDPNTVRRKYTERGGYLYAAAGVRGLDTNDFNDLDEVAALFIPPECIIGAIGPIVGEDEEHYQLIVGQHQVNLNPNCNQPAAVIAAAQAVLLQLCHA